MHKFDAESISLAGEMQQLQKIEGGKWIIIEIINTQ